MKKSTPIKVKNAKAVNNISHWESLTQKLTALDTYFYKIPLTCNSEDDQRIFTEIKALRQLLQRPNKQVTFFGVFKAGKSTLLNAIIGQKILPSRTNRATGVVTKISYNPQPSAKVIQINGVSKSIQLKDIGEYILLNVSEKIAKAPENINAVEIGIPRFLLENNDFSLVDTPGLLDNPMLTQRTWEEIERSDLCIIVLPADKLLSEEERNAVERVNNLLNGNILFVINRIGLIEPEEKEEVIEWVEDSLKGFGNQFVGKPQFFVTDAQAVLDYQTNQKVENIQEYLPGIEQLKLEIKRLFSDVNGDKLALLSRLGILNNKLQQAQVYFQFKLAVMEEEVNKLEQKALEEVKQKQAEFFKSISDTKLELMKVKSDLYQAGEELINKSIRQAQSVIYYSDNTKWAYSVKKNWRANCQSYISQLKEKTESALSNISLDIIRFNQYQFEQCKQINIEEDTATKVTDAFGASLVLGAWRFMGESILGFNLQEENMAAVRKAASTSLSNLRGQTEKYFKQLENNVEKYSRKNEPKLETPEQKR